MPHCDTIIVRIPTWITHPVDVPPLIYGQKTGDIYPLSFTLEKENIFQYYSWLFLNVWIQFTCQRSVVYSGYSGFLQVWNWHFVIVIIITASIWPWSRYVVKFNAIMFVRSCNASWSYTCLWYQCQTLQACHRFAGGVTMVMIPRGVPWPFFTAMYPHTGQCNWPPAGWVPGNGDIHTWWAHMSISTGH